MLFSSGIIVDVVVTLLFGTDVEVDILKVRSDVNSSFCCAFTLLTWFNDSKRISIDVNRKPMWVQLRQCRLLFRLLGGPMIPPFVFFTSLNLLILYFFSFEWLFLLRATTTGEILKFNPAYFNIQQKKTHIFFLFCLPLKQDFFFNHTPP